MMLTAWKGSNPRGTAQFSMSQKKAVPEHPQKRASRDWTPAGATTFAAGWLGHRRRPSFALGTSTGSLDWLFPRLGLVRLLKVLVLFDLAFGNRYLLFDARNPLHLLH
jgi:hypothetical protein